MQHNKIFVSEKIGTSYTSELEEGDYIPYFNDKKINIQSHAGEPILFVVSDVYEPSFPDFDIDTYFICNESQDSNPNIIVNKNIRKLFPEGFILTTPNLKIHKIFEKIEDVKIENIPEIEPPIIIVPNVITEKFKNELIEYYENSNKNIVELKGTKNRRHVFPDKEFTKRLDDKLSKSLLPELKKIYNIDITYRENFKICSYTAEDKGKFHAHRDSIYPFGHRRLAMSLILNDDYEGGGIIFPEYNNKAYKPQACSAVIFPTPLYHQVLEVTGGRRYVIIAFFFGDEEADYKKDFNELQKRDTNIDKYKMTVQRDQRGFLVNDICPQKWHQEL